MKSGTDPDIFMTRVWHLAEQINSIGGSITMEKRADIILQGLPAEYDLIRYSDSAEGGYTLDKIESTARNIWYSHTKSGSTAVHRGHRGTARDAGMTATFNLASYNNRSSQHDREDSGYNNKLHVQCYNCHRMGHYQNKCPLLGQTSQQQRQQRQNGQQERQGRPPQRQSRQQGGHGRQQGQQGHRQGSNPNPRVTKWCSRHNTHLHSDAECKAQASERRAGGRPQYDRGHR